MSASMSNGRVSDPVDSVVGAGSPARPICIGSTELFAGRRELCIDHAGEIYRLRITGKGKLILTK